MNFCISFQCLNPFFLIKCLNPKMWTSVVLSKICKRFSFMSYRLYYAFFYQVKILCHGIICLNFCFHTLPYHSTEMLLYVSASTVWPIMLNLFLCFGKFTFQEYLNIFFFLIPTFYRNVVYHNLGSSFWFFFPWMVINNTNCWIYFIRCHFLTYLMLYTRHQLTG
jgi:hypothetical protein